MSEEKKQVNAEIGQTLFAKFVDELSETYNTKKIIIIGVVEPGAVKGSEGPQLVFATDGGESIDFREFSFQLFKMIGKLTNIHALSILKQAAINTKNAQQKNSNQS